MDRPAPSDRITLTGLRAVGHHGVYDFERERGQEFVVDATLELDLRPAAGADDVRETVHYGELAQRLVEILTGDPVNLIETLAQRLVDACLADPRVRAASVTVHKPGAPIPHEFADVSVTLRRTRPGDRPDGASGHQVRSHDTPGAASGDQLREGGYRAVLSLGANLGDRLAQLQGAVQGLRTALAEQGGQVRAVSAVYETPPWGDVEQPSYLNAAVLVTEAGPPHELLRLASELERQAGRVRDPARRYGPRPLDVDIIAVWRPDGEPVSLDEPALTLPHPRAHLRAFVLRPWLDLDASAELPGHGPVAELLAQDSLRGDLASVVARMDLRLDPAP